MTADPHPWVVRAFGIAALVGVGGWMLLLGVWAWWMLQPADLPTVTEPIAVLNEGNKVAIGSPLVLELQVNKPVDRTPISSSRLLECESGNLVTLTSTPTPLPVGAYTVISDNLTIPAKVTPGDTCVATFLVTFRINPLRDETARWSSEPFTVLPMKEGQP